MPQPEYPTISDHDALAALIKEIIPAILDRIEALEQRPILTRFEELEKEVRKESDND